MVMTQKQLKNKLKKITFNPDDVDDPYFKDYWEETAGKKDDIKDGIKNLQMQVPRCQTD